MPFYRLAGQDFYSLYPVAEIESFKTHNETNRPIFPLVLSSFSEIGPGQLISRTEGWVGNRQRSLEVCNVPSGILLKVDGCGKYLIPATEEISSQLYSQPVWSQCDRQVILGPALVIALALCGVWAFHASAALFAEMAIVFPGESGQGKSTLAAYLSGNSNWQLVADDILPVKADLAGVNVLPHFPQLKLSADAQPGAELPEALPLTKLCVLTRAGQDTIPELRLLPSTLAIQVLLRHTAGTRMFTPEMLGAHLSFCSRVAGQVPVYRLFYPHRRDALPRIKELLEDLC